MNKLLQLKRLSLPLAARMILIYLKKALGFKIKGADHIYLTYFFTLNRCDLRHVKEEENSFRVVTRDGVHLYLRKFPSSDAQVLYQIWTEKEYEVVAAHIKKNFHGKKLRIIDAGANVGYASLFLFRQLRQDYDLEFIIIEPGTDNLALLEKNFRANNMSNYHIEKAGLFNKSCFLNITTDFRDGKDWSLRVEESTSPTGLEGVEVLDILRKYNWDYVDFFKIDIEGSEKHLFEDNNYATRFLDKVRLISIEIHEEFIPGKKIGEVLTGNFFDCFAHGEITIGDNRRFKYEN